MGTTHLSYCLDCRVAGPVLGDFGFLGYPNLKAESSDEIGGRKTFGYIYEGFEAMKVQPYDFEKLKSFLSIHSSHHLIVDTEGRELPAGVTHTDLDEMSEAEYPLDENEFVRAYYEIRCPDNGSKYRAEYEEKLRHFVPFNLTNDILSVFEERVLKVGLENFYRCEHIFEARSGFSKVKQFLTENEGLALIAALDIVE